jgi:hypothetical protein
MKGLAENGLVGFGLLAAFVGSFAVSAWKRRHDPIVRVGFLVSAVLTAAFTSTEFQPRGLWLLAAGATSILHRRYLVQALLARAPAPRWRLLRAAHT